MIILDTHILVWWVGLPEKLSSTVLQHIEKAAKNNEILVSSISIWEIALLVKRGRLILTMDVENWIKIVEQLPIRFVSVDNSIAVKSVSLPDPFHSDPADRMIVATALIEEAALITADKRILAYPYVQTIW